MDSGTLQVNAEKIVLYTPPGVLKEDIAIVVPRLFAIVKRLEMQKRKETGHSWAVDARFSDMQVHYVFQKLVGLSVPLPVLVSGLLCMSCLS